MPVAGLNPYFKSKAFGNQLAAYNANNPPAAANTGLPPTLANWAPSLQKTASGAPYNPQAVAANVQSTGIGQTITMPGGGTHSIYATGGGGGYEQHAKNLQQGVGGTVAPTGLDATSPAGTGVGAPPAETAITDPYSPTGGQSVADIYMNQLGREPDPEGMAFYQNELDSGRMTYAQVQAAIQASEEGQGYSNPNEQWLNQQYQQMFGRDMDMEGQNFYTDLMRQGVPPEEILRRMQAGAQEGDQTYVTPLEEQTLTGQKGVVSATRKAEEEAITAIDTGLDESVAGYKEAGEVYDPYYESGVAADKLQADLSGANGPEAQAKAYAEFKDSPGQQYLRDQAEQALARQAAATGGLGSGALQADLQAQAVGLAEQAYQQRFSDLGTIADRGLVAGKGKADQLSKGGDASFLAGQEKARIYGNAGEQIAYGAIAGAQLIDGALAQEGSALANLQLDAGTAIEDMINQSGKGFDALIAGVTAGNQADLALVWSMLSKLSSEEIQAAISAMGSAGSSSDAGTNMIAQALEAAGIGMSIYGEYKQSQEPA